MPINKIVTNAIEDNAVTSTKTVGDITNFLVPAGAIIMWSGASVPSGWALCDGTNDTPNLVNRFVVGAGSTYSLDATGGSANATLPSHTHGSGTLTVAASSNITDTTDATSGTSFTAPSGWSATSTSVSGSTASEGSSAVNANLPPYYALAYIMKLA
jgi:microcystin-dependent protein